MIDLHDRDEFGHLAYQILTYENFKKQIAHVQFESKHGEKQATHVVQAGPLWLKHPEATRFAQTVFYPTPPTTPTQEFPMQSSERPVFNLFKGWPIRVNSEEPIHGTCATYLELLREGMCGGQELDYLYLLDWMALGIQKPDVKKGVAVILKSGQGTGKGQAVSHYGSLFGSSFVSASQASHVTSHFNGYLRTALLLFVDEAALIDPKTQGIVKAMITEVSQLNESKGVDARMTRSFYDLILASNEDNVMRLDSDDRRCFMPPVSDKFKGNRAFFEKLNTEMKNGGRDALFSMLLNRDISSFDPAVRPSSDMSAALLFEQKYHSIDSVSRYIYHGLQNNDYPFDRPGEKIELKELAKSFSDFLDSSRDRGASVPTRPLMIKMSIILKGHITDKGHSKYKRYKSFAPLLELRKAFENHYQAPPSIWDI